MFLGNPTILSVARTLGKVRCLGTSNLGGIKDEFRKQAPNFENNWSARYKSSSKNIMEWIEKIISPCLKKGAITLDVAAGTAIFARTLAPLCSSVSAIDITLEMLEEGKKKAKSEGHDNIEFFVGDAADLPFPDDSFDLVVCRLAIHHFPEPEKQVGEMIRVCKKYGHVALVDLTAPEDPVLARMQNKIERLRDPSHARALTVREIEDLLVGYNNVEVIPECLEKGVCINEHGRIPRSVLQNSLTLEGWMDSTNTPPENKAVIREIVHKELDTKTPLTGMGLFYDIDDEGNKIICFHHNWVVVIGRKL
jgi:ubiquinone/menaquinone biosynthesis C-methylase UbiE